MTGCKSIFHSIKMSPNFKTTQVVCFVDGETILHITGIGAILIKVYIYTIEIENLLYVPQLDETLFSITEHIKINNCSFIGNDSKYILSFLNFSILVMIINEVFFPFEIVSHRMKQLPSFSTKLSNQIIINTIGHNKKNESSLIDIPSTIQFKSDSVWSNSKIHSPTLEPNSMISIKDAINSPKDNIYSKAINAAGNFVQQYKKDCCRFIW